MHIVSTIIEAIIAYAGAHPVFIYVIVFFGSYADAIIGVNFIVRGEVFFLAGAILAGTGVLNIWLISLLVLGASILGDHTSYWLGLRYGNLLFKEGRGGFNPSNHKKGAEFFSKFGAKSVLLARLLGPLTWITPFIAGMYRVPYREFLPYNILGVCIGVGQFLVIGYFFGASYTHILALEKRYAPLLILALAIVALLYYLFKKRIIDAFEAVEKKDV